MQTLVDTTDLKISFSPGHPESNEAIVACTGIGHALGGIQKEEFAKSLEQRLERDVYYIIDRKRSWFNSTGQYVIAFLRDRLENKNVITLGNSMGGFGALLLGDMLAQCTSAIAFCPQYSVHPSIVPKEERWKEYTTQIGEWLFPTCLPASRATCRRFIFFGENDKSDMVHARHFAQQMHGTGKIYVVKDCHHNVANYLKQKGLLQDLLSLLTQRHPDTLAVEQLLARKTDFYDLRCPP